MIRFKAILIRIIKELVRDKRTLALMFLAPLLILTLMNIMFNSTENTKLKIGLNDSIPTEIVKSFPKDKVDLKKYNTDISSENMIKDHNLDAFLTLDRDKFHLTFNNSNPSTTAQVGILFSNILTENKLKEMGLELEKLAVISGEKIENTSYTIDKTYVYGSDKSTYFDVIFPVLIGFFVFFFVFLISGMALLKERTSGTLERLLATPVKRSEIVMGYLVGYGLFAIIQTLLIVLFSTYILDIHVSGSFSLVLLTNILLSLVALSMGIFISTFANSEFQMMQFIPLVVLPQIFFSGLIPLDSMSKWIRDIGYILPLSYAGETLTNIMIKGEGITVIWPNLLILLVFILIFTTLNIVGLKRYRKV